MRSSTSARQATVRPPAHAGRFYPADTAELRRVVARCLEAAAISDEPAPKALIAPHAGYVYSGPIAASAYVRLQKDRRVINRIVLIGPAHYEAFPGVATSGLDAFRTPLGDVPLDRPAVDQVANLPWVHVLDRAHEPEHCLEVHLPFLQTILERFTLVPLLVGDAHEEQIARALALLWNGSATRIVVSSDLSHYHSAADARMLDQATARAIETLNAERLHSEQACGWQAIRGLLAVARERGLRARTVDLRHSGDTGGPRDQVVGYGAFVFEGQ